MGGGYWLDATLFVNRSLDISGLNHIFSSIKMKPLHPCTISDYRWAGFFLFAYPRSTAMKFFRDVMVQYFLDGHRYTIDYLFIDYTFQMLYERRPEFKNIIDNEPVGNEFTYELRNVLNSKPDFNQLASWKSQRIFKLGWNLPIIKGDTTYNYLLNKT